MKVKKVASWVAVAAGLMAVLQIAVTYVKSNKSFEIVYSAEHKRPGYEDYLAQIRVYASPAIKWGETSDFGKGLGRVFWVAIAAACFYVGTDRHLTRKPITNNSDEGKGNQLGKAIGIVFAPVVACAITWFASYSASLDQGSLVKNFDEFKTEFKIDNETADKIVKEGGTGINIKDNNGLLTAYFTK